MVILNDKQIRQKVTRLAYEIIEQNISEKKVILAGINNNGYAFAEILLSELNRIAVERMSFELVSLKLQPASPASHPIELDVSAKEARSAVVIIVDDVANTGRTLFYAFKPLMANLVRKIQVAVLVDRKHKSFPIHVDYLGLSLATTLNEHIDVNLANKGAWKVEIQ